jgi:antibiotic biosynthesis monooxygenase (ABM) superfamily enzyme
MISRIWHGYTSHACAEAYEHLLREEVFAGIRARRIPGFIDVQMLRRQHEREVEFMTIMRFDDMNAVKAFAGPDFELSQVPSKASALLARFDERSQHYEVKIMDDGRRG